MQIGIVEPEPLLADLMSFRLELLGHSVTVWSNAADMLAQLELGQSDAPLVELLIVDTYLPDLSGCDAMSKVRKLHSSQELPILALSVDTDLQLVEQAVRSGANDYLITPFEPTTLQEKIDELLLTKQREESK